MSAVSGGGGNYISDGAIMAWLANQQDRIYGDLKDSMDLAEDRATFTKQLNDIKSELQTANKTHDFSKLDKDLQSFMEMYGEDPRFAEDLEGIGDMAKRIHDDRQAFVDYDSKKADYDAQQAAFAKDPKALLKAIMTNTLLPQPQPPAPQGYGDKDMQDFKDMLDHKTDGAGKNDQLTMIHIQELKATLDQGSQLASTFISSGDKTQSAIINNIA